jgi:hypothetical protein
MHCSSDTITYHYAHSVTSLISWLLICCKKDIQWGQLKGTFLTGIHPVRGKCSLAVFPVWLPKYFYEMTSHREVLIGYRFKFENNLITSFYTVWIRQERDVGAEIARSVLWLATDWTAGADLCLLEIRPARWALILWIPRYYLMEIERPGSEADRFIKERVDLYIHFPYMPSWPGHNFTCTFRNGMLFVTRWEWLGHCATSGFDSRLCLWKFCVSGIFHLHNPSGRTVALGSTQPLTEMSTKIIYLGGKGSQCVGLIILPPSCADWLEIWEPQPPETFRACPGL